MNIDYETDSDTDSEFTKQTSSFITTNDPEKHREQFENICRKIGLNKQKLNTEKLENDLFKFYRTGKTNGLWGHLYFSIYFDCEMKQLYDDPFELVENKRYCFQVDISMFNFAPIIFAKTSFLHNPSKYRILSYGSNPELDLEFAKKFVISTKYDNEKLTCAILFSDEFFEMLCRTDRLQCLVQLLLVIYNSDYVLNKYKN